MEFGVNGKLLKNETYLKKREKDFLFRIYSILTILNLAL